MNSFLEASSEISSIFGGGGGGGHRGAGSAGGAIASDGGQSGAGMYNQHQSNAAVSAPVPVRSAACRISVCVCAGVFVWRMCQGLRYATTADR